MEERKRELCHYCGLGRLAHLLGQAWDRTAGDYCAVLVTEQMYEKNRRALASLLTVIGGKPRTKDPRP